MSEERNATATLGPRLKAAGARAASVIAARSQPAIDAVSRFTAPARQWLAAIDLPAVAGLRAHVGLIVGFSAAINLLYLAPSLYMLQVYDRVIPTSGILTLVLLSVVLLGSLAVLAVLDALRSRLLVRAALRMERDANEVVREAHWRARRFGEQPIATARDVDTMRQGITSPAAIGVLDLPWTPLFVLVCFVIHFWIGVLALGGAALIFGLALINERATRNSLTSLSTKAARYYLAHDSDLNVADTIHALGVGPRLADKRGKARADYVGAQTEASFIGAGYSAATKALRMLLQSAALGLGAYLAVERQISPGAIIAATILTARAFAPVEQIVGGWRQLAMGLTAYRAIQRLQAEYKRPLARTPLPEPQGRIQIEAVSALAPDGRTVALHSVSANVAPGEIIGIVGPSGAGKTTLARVLANAVPVRGGAIRLDGARYADWDDAALARHIGYLPQRIDLFDGTIAENIAMFEDGDSGTRVVDAAMKAGAHDMILRLPRGYETELGQGGAGISPGQAQRVALARAFYGDPKVIVLDEPNSHLDQEGETALVTALEGVRERGGVVFVVAHRAGVLAIVDKIMVLKDGRLLEFGPRAQVIAKLAGARPDAALTTIGGGRP
jgi:ATP-binding cassette subfamily C protein